jgi:hypothetical protein
MFINHHEIPFDYRRFTYYGLKKIAEEAGFDVISIDSRGNHLTVTIAAIYTSAVNLLSRRPFSDL